jgi:hypothetical protein
MKTQDPNAVTEAEDRDDPDVETIRDPSTGQQAKVGTAIENVYEDLSGRVEYNEGMIDSVLTRLEQLESRVEELEAGSEPVKCPGCGEPTGETVDSVKAGLETGRDTCGECGEKIQRSQI